MDSREHFLREDGSPDLSGRTYAYRQFVRDLYGDAKISSDLIASVQAAVRYHVSNVLRERLTEDQLDEYGLIPQNARERSQDRRHARTAVLNAYAHREIAGGALLSLTAALAVLKRLTPSDLDELDDAEREIAAEALRDVERRVSALLDRVTK